MLALWTHCARMKVLAIGDGPVAFVPYPCLNRHSMVNMFLQRAVQFYRSILYRSIFTGGWDMSRLGQREAATAILGPVGNDTSGAHCARPVRTTDTWDDLLCSPHWDSHQPSTAAWAACSVPSIMGTRSY